MSVFYLRTRWLFDFGRPFPASNKIPKKFLSLFIISSDFFKSIKNCQREYAPTSQPCDQCIVAFSTMWISTVTTLLSSVCCQSLPVGHMYVLSCQTMSYACELWFCDCMLPLPSRVPLVSDASAAPTMAGEYRCRPTVAQEVVPKW